MHQNIIFMNFVFGTINAGIILALSYYFLPRNKLLQSYFQKHQKFLHPNKISLYRAVSGPIIALIILLWDLNWITLSLIIQAVIIMAASDALDGQIARNCQLETEKWKSFDALADKYFDLPILLVSTWTVLPSYVFLIIGIVIFDIIGQSIRKKTDNPAANTIWKSKTCCKFVTLILLLIMLIENNSIYQNIAIIWLFLSFILWCISMILKYISQKK